MHRYMLLHGVSTRDRRLSTPEALLSTRRARFSTTRARVIDGEADRTSVRFDRAAGVGRAGARAPACFSQMHLSRA